MHTNNILVQMGKGPKYTILRWGVGVGREDFIVHAVYACLYSILPHNANANQTTLSSNQAQSPFLYCRQWKAHAFSGTEKK